MHERRTNGRWPLHVLVVLPMGGLAALFWDVKGPEAALSVLAVALGVWAGVPILARLAGRALGEPPPRAGA